MMRERKRKKNERKIKDYSCTTTASCTLQNCHFTYKVAALECM